MCSVLGESEFCPKFFCKILCKVPFCSIFVMSSPAKRKALTVEEKLSFLKRYDQEYPAKTQKQLAEEFGIPGSTLRTILKNRSKIVEVVGGCKRQKLRAGQYEDLEEILLEWFHQARATNLPISGPILKEKAFEIAGRLSIEDFSASCGWLDRFRKRHGIVYRQISGESEAINECDISAWTESTLPMLLKNYNLDDVYNADEFGLFFKLMPDKSLVFKSESCHGGKLSKERVTVMACTNATGTHKVKLFVIGKSKSPRCFKGVHTLPVRYDHQNRAWMTGELYIAWLKELDMQFQKQNRKVLLFVDNCPAHPKDVTLQCITIVHLLPNATGKLQPLDQGIIKVIKQRYQKKLVQRHLKEMEATMGNADRKPVNILDAIHYVAAAWESIEPETIQNCFRKVKFGVGGMRPQLEKKMQMTQTLTSLMIQNLQTMLTMSLSMTAF